MATLTQVGTQRTVNSVAKEWLPSSSVLGWVLGVSELDDDNADDDDNDDRDLDSTTLQTLSLFPSFYMTSEYVDRYCFFVL